MTAPSPPPTTLGGGTPDYVGWVQEARLHELVHASDGFQVLLAIAVAAFGGLVAFSAALLAGALHPFPLYLVITGLGVATALSGGLAWREFKHYRQIRKKILESTQKLPVSLLMVTPGSPSFTIGAEGQVPMAAGPQVGPPSLEQSRQDEPTSDSCALTRGDKSGDTGNPEDTIGDGSARGDAD